MGDEIFSVYLTPADYSKLAYAKLDLPASPWKLLDAMDKVRLPEGDSLYLEITDYFLKRTNEFLLHAGRTQKENGQKLKEQKPIRRRPVLFHRKLRGRNR